MNKKRILGILLIILAGLIALSNLTLTGNVIGESAVNYLSLVAVVFFIVGCVLIFMAERSRPIRPKSKLIDISDSGVNIAYSNRFKKVTKRHDLRRVNSALAKIGTGKGDEHILNTHERSIDGGHDGARIIFDKTEDPTTAYVKAYLSSHEYDQYIRNTS